LTEEGYKELLPLLESLKEVCSVIAAGSRELKDRLIAGVKERLKNLFFFIRLLITRDFESGTGMNLDKWTEFADKLSKRSEDILSAVRKTHDCSSAPGLKEFDESLAQLEHASGPFLSDYAVTVEALGKLQQWLVEVPNKIKSAPPGFVNDEDRRAMIEDSAKGVNDLKKLIQALDETRTKLLIIRNGRTRGLTDKP
jgi:hypothetical protein